MRAMKSKLGKRASRTLSPMGSVDVGPSYLGPEATQEPVETSGQCINQCSKCGRSLSNTGSVIIGMGPICAGRNIMAMKQRKLEAQGQQVLFPQGQDVVLVRMHDETATCNIPIRENYHSPSGIEWGFAGSGPADLALNILMHFGLDRGKSWGLHQDFKRDFIEGIPRHGGTIPAAEIRNWIITKEKEAEMPCNTYKHKAGGKKSGKKKAAKKKAKKAKKKKKVKK